MMVLKTGVPITFVGVALLLSCSAQSTQSPPEYPFGAHTYLSFGDCCEFEASNCIPVTWLALFAAGDWIVEPRQRGPEEYVAALYQTTRMEALQRVDTAIERASSHPDVWAYLRPLEILRDELERCGPGARVELKATQVWQGNDEIRRVIRAAVADFAAMMDGLSEEGESKLAALTALVNRLNYSKVSSVADLDADARMFVLIGTYWGDGEREELYSLEYFNEDYWNAER